MTKELTRATDLEEFLSTTEAAQILGVHPVAVGQMLQRGRLPGRKVARNWIIPKAALLEFARDYVKGPGRRKPQAEKGRHS